MNETERKYKVGFIGCGKMGRALAVAVSKSEAVEEILLFDRFSSLSKWVAKDCSEAREGIAARPADSALEVARECDFIFLGVKPDGVASVFEEIAEGLNDNSEAVIVSIAAGVSIASLTEYYYDAMKVHSPKTSDIDKILDEAFEISEDDLIGIFAGAKSEAVVTAKPTIVRIMPNTSVEVGAGVVVFETEAVGEKVREIPRILEKAGLVRRVKEEQMDAITAISGCGPAFVYTFIEAMADAAVRCGIPKNAALEYAAKTVEGAGKMAERHHPAHLRDDVCSPGGSTIEGIYALEEGGLRAAVMSAVAASYEKSKNLGKK